jgi:iron-sulfur cluster repair protein YtfE (RIC family)
MNSLITPWADEARLDPVAFAEPVLRSAVVAATIGTARPTEPLRLEHRELLPSIDALASTADIAGIATEDELRDRVADAYRFLTHHLVPHARAEDVVLYPAVELAMHAPGATDTMRRDHVEVVRYIEALGEIVGDAGAYDEAVRARVRAILYSLHAIVALHFAKEEELYLEVLDRALDERRAETLFTELEAAAAEAKAALD